MSSFVVFDDDDADEFVMPLRSAWMRCFFVCVCEREDQVWRTEQIRQQKRRITCRRILANEMRTRIIVYLLFAGIMQLCCDLVIACAQRNTIIREQSLVRMHPKFC